MAYPSFGEIAAKLDIPRCRGLTQAGYRCEVFDHRRGQIGDGQVHWADRARVERAGIRRFLRLAAILYYAEQEPRAWARIYLAQRLINAWASQLGVRIPSELSDHDRLEVKAMLVNIPTDAPLRKEAMAWAQAR